MAFFLKMKQLILMLKFQKILKLLDNNNPILKNATIAVPLKYLSNFWRSLEVPLINCKVRLKQRKTNYCGLASAGVGHDGTGYNDFIFAIKDTQLYAPVVNFSAKGNQKLSNCFSKIFERSVYWNEYKTKSENKNTKN